MILARRFSAAHAVLAVILAIALWLRVFGPTMHGFDWGQGNFQHPDENYIGGLVGGLGYPSSPLDLFNRNSSWNPAAVPNLAGVANGSLPHTGFNYGSLPLYLIKIFSSILSWLGAHFSIFGNWQHANPILAGRVLSGAFDTITVALVFLLGRRLADDRAGLFAAALASFAVLSIQLAHFTTVDSFLGTFSTGTVLAGVTLFQEGRARDYVMLGIWLAAACATKASAAPLVAIAAMAVLWRQQERGRLRSWETVRRSAVLAVIALVALFVFQPYMFVDWSDFRADLSSQNDLATGRVLTFYTIRWRGDTPLLSPLSQLTNCSLGIPLALLGYAGLAWQIIRLSARKWLRGAIAGASAGLALILCGILAAASFPLSSVQCNIGPLHVDTIVLTCVETLAPLWCLIVALFLPRRSGTAMVAFFVFTYFLAAGLLYMQYLRYMEPVVPSLCVLAALLVPAMAGDRARTKCPAPCPPSLVVPAVQPAEAVIVQSHDPVTSNRSTLRTAAKMEVICSRWQARLGRWRRGASYGLGGAVLFLTGFYAIAYQHIYAQPLTRNQAACWMYRHVSAGAIILQDFPDELQPDGGSNGCDNGRVYASLTLLAFAVDGLIDYQDDSLGKVQRLSPWLSRAQYYIINSERAVSTFWNDGARYPYMQRFYKLLLGSKQGVQDALGFTLVYHVTEHAQLGPWTDTEDGVSEDFDEYDHPAVWIFQNTGQLSATQIVRAITDDGHIPDPSMPSVSKATHAPT